MYLLNLQTTAPKSTWKCAHKLSQLSQTGSGNMTKREPTQGIKQVKLIKLSAKKMRQHGCVLQKGRDWTEYMGEQSAKDPTNSAI